MSILYLVFCEGGVEVSSATGRLRHQVVPVFRQLVHLVPDVGSRKVPRGDKAIARVEHTLDHGLMTLQLNVQLLRTKIHNNLGCIDGT